MFLLFSSLFKYFNGRLTLPNITSNVTSGGTAKDYNYDSWMALLSQLPLLLFTLLNSFLYQWWVDDAAAASCTWWWTRRRELTSLSSLCRVRERLRVAFSMIVIFILFSLTAALVQVPMLPDTFFSVTMATIWFINSEFTHIITRSLRRSAPSWRF